jgi:hypothetical protein
MVKPVRPSLVGFDNKERVTEVNLFTFFHTLVAKLLHFIVPFLASSSLFPASFASVSERYRARLYIKRDNSD